MAGLLAPRLVAAADTAAEKLRARAIPHGGEMLPVVGLGTAMVFDVGSNSQQQACLLYTSALVELHVLRESAELRIGIAAIE